MQREGYVSKFQEVTQLIDNALNGISYDKLNISEEVKEQVIAIYKVCIKMKNEIFR